MIFSIANKIFSDIISITIFQKEETSWHYHNAIHGKTGEYEVVDMLILGIDTAFRDFLKKVSMPVMNPKH